jgi:hypothetical protein
MNDKSDEDRDHVRSRSVQFFETNIQRLKADS